MYEWCAWVAVRLDRQRLCAVGCVSVSVGSCEHLRVCVRACLVMVVVMVLFVLCVCGLAGSWWLGSVCMGE